MNETVYWSLSWRSAWQTALSNSRGSYRRYRVWKDPLRSMWRVDATDRPSARVGEPCS